jgi:hypothetical protein
MALIDKASLLMVPSTYEAGKLYNVLPSGNRAPDNKGGAGYDQTRADFDFDRGSNTAATRIGSDGLIKKYRENKLLQSEAFSASWSAFSATATTGQSGYDGTTNALLLTSTGNYARIQQAASGTGIMTASCYMKAGTTSWAMIRVAGSGYNITQYFDLENGVIGSLSGVSASINLVSDSWYRCEVVVNVLATPTFYIYTALADGNLSVTNETITIQSPQFESGLVATTFIPTTSVTGKAGVLVDLPRINYDANGENGALLLEPSRANLITQSEYFSNWTKVDTTLTYNYNTSPEGLKNSTRVQFADSTAYMYIAPAGTSSGTYASSIYIKGTAGETIKFGKGGNVASGAMHTLNGDWQRIEHITTDVGLSVHISTYGGSTARDIEIYGCQLEAGSYVSSYIPTMGTSETRAADSCLDAGNSDVFNDSEGVLFIESSAIAADSTNKVITISDGTTANRVQIYYNSSNNIIGGVAGQAAISYSGDITETTKIAFKYKANDFALWVNGVEIGTDNVGSAPSGLNQIDFHNGASGSPFYGNMKQLIYFNEAVSDSELATLTTL